MYDQLIARYEQVLRPMCVDQVDGEDTDVVHSAIGDLAEIYEDCSRFLPLLRKIIECECTDKEFEDSVRTIEAWSWHTADHLNHLRKCLDI